MHIYRGVGAGWRSGISWISRYRARISGIAHLLLRQRLRLIRRGLLETKSFLSSLWRTFLPAGEEELEGSRSWDSLAGNTDYLPADLAGDHSSLRHLVRPDVSGFITDNICGFNYQVGTNLGWACEDIFP